MLEDITPDLIEAYLRAIRSGEKIRARIIPLDFIDQFSNAGPKEQAYLLAEYLTSTISQSYLEQRRLEERAEANPSGRQEVLERIQQDFNSGNPTLEAWSALYHRYVSPVSFSVEDLARAASVVPQQYRRRVNQGLTFLVQKIQQQVMQARQPATGSRLPLPDYTRLVGVQPYFDRLDSLLNDPTGPRLVSLEGIGGIGKTALARAFAALPGTLEHWHKVVWVSARQSSLSEEGRIVALTDAATTLEDISARLAEQLGLAGLAGKSPGECLEGLRAYLAGEQTLVVVDNLETVEEYAQVVPTLAGLAGASRFLVTTRTSAREFSFVHTIPLHELDTPQAYALLQAELERRGRPGMVSSEAFEPLYRSIGGIPLALKLAAAQLSLRPLAEILEGFRATRPGIEELYHYLYWQTWQALHDPARRLLLSFLPADPEGEDLEFLRLMSGQPDEFFFEALRELDRFSLLEVDGDTGYPRYRLHRLTVTFLQTDILDHWSRGTTDDNPASP